MKLNLPIRQSAVTDVSAVQLHSHKRFSRNGNGPAEVTDLTARPLIPPSVTSETVAVTQPLRQTPIWNKACTPVTSVTSQREKGETKPQPASAAQHRVTLAPDALAANFEERAAILQFDAGLSRKAAEMSAWKMVYGGDD